MSRMAIIAVGFSPPLRKKMKPLRFLGEFLSSFRAHKGINGCLLKPLGHLIVLVRSKGHRSYHHDGTNAAAIHGFPEVSRGCFGPVLRPIKNAVSARRSAQGPA